MCPRLKNCRFKVGSGAGREKKNFHNPRVNHLLLCHLHFPNLWVPSKLHVVIKSVDSQCQRPSSPHFFSFPVRLQVAGIWNRCICHLRTKYSQSPCCKRHWCLFLPLWELDWRELKGPVYQLGERRAEELLLATHHLEKLKPNFFFFFFFWSMQLCFHLLGEGETARGCGEGCGGQQCQRQLKCLASVRVYFKSVKRSL